MDAESHLCSFLALYAMFISEVIDAVKINRVN